MKPKDFSLTEAELSRFWAKLVKRDGCWTFTGKLGHGGYGEFLLRRNGKWQRVKAHRVMCHIVVGGLTSAYIVCHKCDNPSCVNPDHLFKGTPKDNTQDMIAKGRSKLKPRPPQLHWKRRITDEQILWARSLPRDEPLKTIENALGIGKRYASRIRLGKTHKWLK